MPADPLQRRVRLAIRCSGRASARLASKASAPDFVAAANRGGRFCFSVIPTEVGRLFLALSFYERRFTLRHEGPTQRRDRGTISNAPPSLGPNYKIASAIFIILRAQP